MIKKLTSIILAIAMLTSFSCAGAASDSPVAPAASYYLSSYSLCMLSQGDELMSISWTVCGVDFMDKVGAIEILVEERIGNTWFEYEVIDGEEEGLFTYNRISATGDVYFYGYAGMTYRATMTVYAELDGGYDTGEITCSPEVCV